MFFAERSRIAALAAQSRLPVVSGAREFAEAGFLMSYGSIFAEQWRRAAAYVDKILQGANPADLPIEQPTKVSANPAEQSTVASSLLSCTARRASLLASATSCSWSMTQPDPLRRLKHAAAAAYAAE